VLEPIAAVAAGTINNARLFQETQRRAEEQAALFDLAQSLSAQLAVDQVLQQIYQGASRLIDTANFYIGLYDPAKHEVSFVINASESVVDQSITTISADQGMTGYIIRTRSSVLIKEDVDQWLKEHGLARVGAAAQSWLGVPLLLGDQILGVMAVQNYLTRHAYTEHDRDLLQVFGAQAAIAIQNARLFEQTRDARAVAESRLRETQILQEFSQAVSQALDVPQVLDALVDTLQHRLNFSHIAIALIEHEAGQITTVRGVGSAANLQGLRRPLEAVQNDITLDIVRNGQVEVIDGWDERFDRAIYEREGHADLVRAFVPVRLRDEVIGLIEAGYQRTGRAQITPEEVRVLSGLADQMAVAIDNARLLEQVQTALGETERLYNASQQIFIAPDVAGMLTALAQHAPVADINRMVVWLFEFDAERQITALVTDATWHSGVGEPPPPPTRPPQLLEALPDNVGVLTPAATLVIEPSFEYVNFSTNRLVFRCDEIITGVQIGLIEASDVDRNTLIGTLAARMGVTNRLEFELRAPYVYRNDEIFTLAQRDNTITRSTQLEGHDMGDIEVSGRYQLTSGRNRAPVWIANLRYKSNTGKGPFEVGRDEDGIANELPTGSGFWGIEPGVTFLMPSDPAVLFANLGYFYHAPDEVNRTINGVFVGEVDPGDSINASLGFGFAVNERFSFSMGYRHNYIFQTESELGATHQSSDEFHAGALQLGLSYRLNNKTSLNANFDFGVTEDAPDVRVVFRLPLS
jgi:GAF domain-containing protein